MIKKNAGKGQKVTGTLGESGFKERVDFGTIIGEYAQEINNQPTKYFPTTKGIIVYSKNGSCHVFPSNPNGSLK